MTVARPRPPKVYSAICAITETLSQTGVAKTGVNLHQGYAFRTIDDITRVLSPLLARHKLCILPALIERSASAGNDLPAFGNRTEQLLCRVSLKVAFDIVCAKDASCHRIEISAEALDESDKATSKAMTSAFKQAVQQVFCIPSSGVAEADSLSPGLSSSDEICDPVQGWERWGDDFLKRLRECSCEAEIRTLQSAQNKFLRALSRRSPEIYRKIAAACRDTQTTTPILRELAASAS